MDDPRGAVESPPHPLSQGERAPVAAALQERLPLIAQRWRQALAPVNFVPLSQRDVLDRLQELAGRAALLLLAEPFDAAQARQIGEHLAALHFTRPEALSRTQEVLGGEFLAALPAGQVAALAPRVVSLLGELAAGFARRARETILSEQEAIRSALLAQRRQVEEALRESEARFRAIFEGAAIGINLTDAQGRLIETNPALAGMLGYAIEELQGQSFMHFADPDDLRGVFPLFQQVMAGLRDHFEVEMRFHHRSGETIWGHVVVSLVRDANGLPKFAIGMGENITERKRAEAALEQQYREADLARSELRATLDATGEAMLLVAPDGRALSANERCAELFALRPEAVRGHPFGDLEGHFARVFEDDRIVATLAALIPDAQQRFTQDVAQVWPERRDLELFSTPVLDAAGLVLGRLFAFRDVTHERAVDRMKSEFVSLVSHELRTPLTSIKGYVELLLAEDAGPMAAEQRDFLTIVKNNSDRLVALISDLLDISRMEAGSLDLHRRDVDLAPLLQEVLAALRPQIDQKRQRVRVEVCAALPPVYADPDRVTQVLTNLIANAHKYTPPRGAITISARPDGGFVRVAVQDTGIGIAPQDQAQLFTRFFRAKNRATQEVSGTGLGLMITRSLVTMHGGEIEVDSTPGEGSTFSFTLPTSPPGPAGAEAPLPAGRTPLRETSGLTHPSAVRTARHNRG